MKESNQNNLLQTNELSSMYTPFSNLLSQLRENIDQGSYGVVISDDTSGRVPALVIHRAISNIYLQRGEKPIGFMGLMGSEEEWHIPFIRNRFKKHYQKNQLKEGKKALLVTEFVGYGAHLDNFRLAIEPEGVIFDVATLNARKDQDFYYEIEALKPTQVLFNAQSDLQKFTDNTSFSGLNPKKFSEEKFIGVKGRKIIDSEKRELAKRVLTHSQQLASILADEYLDIE